MEDVYWVLETFFRFPESRQNLGKYQNSDEGIGWCRKRYRETGKGTRTTRSLRILRWYKKKGGSESYTKRKTHLKIRERTDRGYRWVKLIYSGGCWGWILVSEKNLGTQGVVKQYTGWMNEGKVRIDETYILNRIT